MLRKLSLTHVGPAARLEMNPVAERFNLITGDNGLGKSFLLELAWWALTRTWAGSPAVPASQDDAEIGFAFDSDAGKALAPQPARWDRKAQDWKRKAGRPPNPGLVLYARVDGSFSVWDPMRNYALYTRQDGAKEEYVHAFHFSPDAVLSGLRREGTGAVLCKGLLDEWTLWQLSGDPAFALLGRLLASLGPEGAPLTPGQPARPYAGDDQLVPTIRMPYGQDVPITFAPAGVQRIVKLAYLLAWALSAHEREARIKAMPVSRQVILLLDEPETHLHPRWQRTVLRSLYDAVSGWRGGEGADVQCLVATHSPLVLASMEPVFDPMKDALWKLDLHEGAVTMERDVWRKRGDANMWLVSEDVLDPFEIGDGWFALDLNSFKTVVGPQAPPERSDAITATIKRLGLDSAEVAETRRRAANAYWSPPAGKPPVPLWFLEENQPFVARELRRQGRLRPEDLPPS
jgi:hypothetical protein